MTTPEIAAVRDADRVIGLLEANGINSPKLIINRIRQDMVKEEIWMNVEDIVEYFSYRTAGHSS